ncbi:MAG: hypothetical protein BGO91_16510 [Leifsonia sp. 71-9]|nr:MAG: hypothetical protein BGO91_16510 [Leifsonia sp. 71-9]
MHEPALVRPTKRALNEMDVPPPTLDIPLSELEHPLVVRAQSLPMLASDNAAERIRSLTDRVWFKVKTGSWRGAVGDVRAGVDEHTRALLDADDAWWWLTAAGPRQNDSPQRDFYARLDVEAHASGPNSCSSDFLLPARWDLRRLEAELALALSTAIPPVVRRAAAMSMRHGEVHGFTAGPTDVRVRIRMLDDGQVYLAIGSTGVTDPKLFALLLSAFDGLTADDWLPEPGPNLNLDPAPGEILWSTMLSPVAQKSLLDELDAGLRADG